MNHKPKNWDEMVERLAEVNPDVIFCDGLEHALIGVVRKFGQETVALYDYNKCIEIRLDDGGTYEEAVEDLEYNTLGAWVGPHTPAFVVTLDEGPLAKSLLDAMTDGERRELFSEYCRGCASTLPCPCWEDE